MIFDPKSSKPISILIADDHQLVREMMYAYISNQDGFEVTLANSYHDALAKIDADGSIDVILMDAQMPGMDGIVSIESFVRAHPNSSVVVFSGTVSNEYVQEALLAGAKGYIPKSLPFKSLLSAITLIASGEVFVPSTFSSANKDAAKSRHFNLSDSELAVLRKVRAGWSNKEIAREMDSTEVTIKMHMRAICTKLGAKNRTQAAVIALQEQIS
jgi:two-component system nitrate/nitrite response regulator NarP